MLFVSQSLSLSVFFPLSPFPLVSLSANSKTEISRLSPCSMLHAPCSMLYAPYSTSLSLLPPTFTSLRRAGLSPYPLVSLSANSKTEISRLSPCSMLHAPCLFFTLNFFCTFAFPFRRERSLNGDSFHDNYKTAMRTRSIIAIIFWLLAVKSLTAQIPGGYYNQASGLSGSALKTTLHKVIRNHQVISYNGLWTAFYSSDDKASGKVWDIYSDIPDGTPPYEYDFGADQCSITPGIENSCYNREHSFPQSYFGSSSSDTIYTDLFQLYPTDSYVNTRRNNYPYGTVGTPSWISQNGSRLGPCNAAGYSGTVFEPLDAFKGDLARTYFYIATRYEHEMVGWTILNNYGDVIMDSTAYPCYEDWFLTMLLQWNADDPVSQKEIDRNNAVYALQGNRNPLYRSPRVC